MASWKEATWNMAWSAAEDYFDHGINKFPGDKNRFKGMDRDEAITKLAKEAVPKLRELVKENEFGDETVRKLDELDVGAVRKYLYEFGEEPFGATRKGDFEKDVVDKWYGWGPKETEAQMYNFGYDPNRPGDKQKFLEEVGEYQKAHDRAKIVQNTIEGKDQTSIFPDFLPNSPAIVQKLAFSAYPAMTKEATRQSLTGDFDDSKMNRATVADVLANSTMAVAPSFKVLSTPVAAGAVAGGAETARQLIQPNDASIPDVMLAATTAGTIPGIGQHMSWTISKGANTSARRFGREFARGLRGADDPVMQERNALKQLLIDARKRSETLSKEPTLSGLNFYDGSADISALAEARKWGEAEAKLNALGFGSEGKYNALVNEFKEAEKELKAANLAEREAILAKPKSRKKVDKIDHEENVKLKDRIREEAQDRFDNAAEAIDQYDSKATVINGVNGYVEDVIGMDPADLVGGPVVAYRAPKANGIEAALNAYDTPPVFVDGFQRGPALSRESITKLSAMEDKYKAAFPEMYRQHEWYGKSNTPNTKALKFTRGLGRVVGGVGGRIEPTTGSLANLLTGGTVGDKVTKFKETKWFNSLPKEKKNAIENALKGE